MPELAKTDRTVAQAAMTPCAHCPWRPSNQGKPHPHGFYTKRNLTRLWAGLRRGERMTCHPTDQRMNEFERHPLRVKEQAQTRECAGALILQQREWMKFDAVVEAGDAFPGYRRRWPRGMTKEGFGRMLSRIMFGGTPLGGKPVPRPDLNQPDVGYEDALGPWPPEGLTLR